jgi:hypothetical protein
MQPVFFSCELYANPINLSYNNKIKYQTSYGGVLSIISGVIIIIWLGLQALQVKHVNFTFTETQSLMDDSTIYYVNQTDFVAATMVKTTDPNYFSGNFSQYVATVYVQITLNETEGRISPNCCNSTDCSNNDLVDMPKTAEYLCPDIPKE